MAVLISPGAVVRSEDYPCGCHRDHHASGIHFDRTCAACQQRLDAWFMAISARQSQRDTAPEPFPWRDFWPAFVWAIVLGCLAYLAVCFG